MPSYSRLTVFNALLETRFVPLFYEPEAKTAQSLAQACIEGGARVIEFTNRGAFALESFAALRRSTPDLILGIGSIVDAPTAALFVAQGADFIVSPSWQPELARFCNRRKIAYLPGCSTLAEISQAEEMGAEIVKFFPANGGRDFIQAVKAPCPWTAIMPTGGIAYEQAEVQAWLAAGAVCLGMGSQLLPRQLIQAGEFEQIRQRVATLKSWVS